jgi:hypothetical protein
MFLKEGEIIFDGGKDELLRSDTPDIKKFTSELSMNVR